MRTILDSNYSIPTMGRVMTYAVFLYFVYLCPLCPLYASFLYVGMKAIYLNHEVQGTDRQMRIEDSRRRVRSSCSARCMCACKAHSSCRILCGHQTWKPRVNLGGIRRRMHTYVPANKEAIDIPCSHWRTPYATLLTPFLSVWTQRSSRVHDSGSPFMSSSAES